MHSGLAMDEQLYELEDELSTLLTELGLAVDRNHSCLGPEQLRVGLPQLSIGRDLSWRLGQVVGLRLEASLVGHVVHAVGVAVISHVHVVSLLLKSASLRLRSRLNATDLLHL